LQARKRGLPPKEKRPLNPAEPPSSVSAFDLPRWHRI
jgi:hypothetical protein